MSKVKEYYLEEEYTPIQAIEMLQQENTKLRIQISAREKEYIKLQEENEYFNQCDEEKRKTITNLRYKIKRLEEESIKLKELCNKYEEEHSTTFEYWKHLVKEDYKSRNEKAIEYIERCRNYHKTYHKEERIFPDEITSLLMILKGSE